MNDKKRKENICEQLHILIQANHATMVFLQQLAIADSHPLTEKDIDSVIEKSCTAAGLMMHRLVNYLFEGEELDIEDLLDKMDKAYQKHQAGAMKMSEVDAEIKRMMRD